MFASMSEIHFDTLAQVSSAELLDTFNESFSDYLVPMHLTLPQLEIKMRSEGVDLSLSAGAFSGEKLVGFILHGVNTEEGKRIAYNAATGVIPAERGKRLTLRLYDHILPLLRQNNISKSRLEVIDTNERAIKTYAKAGFMTVRRLDSFKGKAATAAIDKVKFIDAAAPSWEQLKTWWDWTPSWQNSIITVENLGEKVSTTYILHEDEPVGYACFSPASGRILQLAINKKHRQRGFGKMLISHLGSVTPAPELSIINVDAAAGASRNFFISQGMKHFISQHEMELVL